MAQTTHPTTAQAGTATGDPAALESARLVGELFDEAITVPGTSFKVGLDPILGILPVAGDTVATVASLYIVFVGLRLGVPPRTLVKMVAYVGVDFFVGSVPLVGTVVDAVLKVNKRNVATIEDHVLDESG